MELVKIMGAGSSSNVFLINGESPILIDTGLYSKDITQRLSEVLAGKPISKIILTHRHIDHIGGAPEVQKQFGGEFFAFETEAHALTMGDDTICARYFGLPAPRLKVSTLNEGDIISSGDVDLKVIHTPGHTDGSICFFHEDSKTLFSGDTVFANGGVGRWDLPSGNLTQLRESLKRLSEIEVDNLYPGHGAWVEGAGGQHIKESRSYLG